MNRSPIAEWSLSADGPAEVRDLDVSSCDPGGMASSRPLCRAPLNGRRYLAIAAVVGLALCLVGFVMDLRSASGHSPGAPWLLAGLVIGLTSSYARVVQSRRAERPGRDR